MNTRRAQAVAAAVLTLALVADTAAEVLPWNEVERQVFVIRRHRTWYPGLEHVGIWTFDPDNGAYQRLVPFEFAGRGWALDFVNDGVGAHLTGGGGLLRFQAWPYYVDLDLTGARLLRRYSPVEDLSPAALGWAVQGVALTPEAAGPLGLEPGVYGFARCLLPMLTDLGCLQYEVPGTSTPVFWPTDDPWPVLRRDLAPDDGQLSITGTVSPHQWRFPYDLGGQGALPLLSLDPGRGAFWRGTPRAVELLGVSDGAIGPVQASFELTLPPFDDPDAQLEALFYHPVRRRFFGIATVNNHTYCADPTFFTVDDAFARSRVYERAECGEAYGVPLTFAAAGEAPLEHEQLLPVVTRSEGRHGTFWTSVLWLFNPSAEPITVRLSRVGSPGVERNITLQPHGSARVPDVLAFAGGGPAGDGSTHDALLITSPFRWGEQVVAVSRVSTRASGGGSFGQAVAAVPGRVGYSNHIPYYSSPPLPHPLYTPIGGEPGAFGSFLSLDRRDPDRFRHNLGIVNTGETPLTLTLFWAYSDQEDWLPPQVPDLRPEAATQEILVAPHALRIVSLEGLFPPEVRDGWAPRLGVFGLRAAAVWLSMVDNITGDATFVPFTNYHWWTNFQDFRVAIPHVAHAPGEGGTTWRTDVYGTGGLDGEDLPTAFLHPREPATDCGGTPAGGLRQDLQGEVGMPLDRWMASTQVEDPEEAAYLWRTIFPDVARLFGPCSAETGLHAALELVGEAWTTGYSRTYTTRPDGGTYGGMLPFYPYGGWPVQHFAGVEVSPSWRVNVGLFNGEGEHTITHRLTLYDAQGALIAQSTLTLPPLASVQRPLHQILGVEEGSLPEGLYGLTVLPLDSDDGTQGRCWAYVSLIDEQTGDPTNWW